jgi:hypothetical protein
MSFINFSKKSGFRIPKRNLLAEAKTDLREESHSLNEVVGQIINNERIELHCPPGIWYGYKDEWLVYSAEANHQEYIKGTLPDCGSFFYEVHIDPDRFVNTKHYPDPYKILKIDSVRAFDRFTRRYAMREVPEEWRDWFSDPEFNMPLELTGQGDEWNIRPQYIHWREVMRDFAGLEIKPRVKKREGIIETFGYKVDSWYDVWTTAGGVIWRPLACIKLELLYCRDLTTNEWVFADKPPKRPPPLPPRPSVRQFHPSFSSISRTSSVSSRASDDTEPNSPDTTEEDDGVGTWPRMDMRKRKERTNLTTILDTFSEQLEPPLSPATSEPASVIPDAPPLGTIPVAPPLGEIPVAPPVIEPVNRVERSATLPSRVFHDTNMDRDAHKRAISAGGGLQNALQLEITRRKTRGPSVSSVKEIEQPFSSGSALLDALHNTLSIRRGAIAAHDKDSDDSNGSNDWEEDSGDSPPHHKAPSPPKSIPLVESDHPYGAPTIGNHYTEPEPEPEPEVYEQKTLPRGFVLPPAPEPPRPPPPNRPAPRRPRGPPPLPKTAPPVAPKRTASLNYTPPTKIEIPKEPAEGVLMPVTPKRERKVSHLIAEALRKEDDIKKKKLEKMSSHDSDHISWPRIRKGRRMSVTKTTKKKGKPLGSWQGEGKKKRIKALPTLPKNFAEMLKKGEMPKEWENWEGDPPAS